MKQKALDLAGGHHAGPLFIAAKRAGPRYQIRGGARRWRFTQSRRPVWADANVLYTLRKMVPIYSKALHRQYSLDHIVPLNSPIVCGLHCEANLTILPLLDNQRKCNREWPGMPEQQLELGLS